MSNTDFMTEVDRFIDEKWEEIVEEIARLVSIPSVADFSIGATPEDPSGPEAHDGSCALRWDLAQPLGFDARDDAGQIGTDLKRRKANTMSWHASAIPTWDLASVSAGYALPWTLLRKDGFSLDAVFWTTKARLTFALYCA